MPRPKSKPELLNLAAENYAKLTTFVDQLPEEKQKAVFPSQYLNRNIGDVLAHLYHWHLMFQNWYRVGMNGEKPDIPAKGYSWKTTPQLNARIREKYANTPLAAVKNLLASSHRDMMSLIESHSNEELFEKKRYKWTGTTSLGAYLISATSSHYDWALKLVKKAMKELG